MANRSDYLKALYVVLFYIFVTPYYIGIDNQGVSANYLFVFFPIIAFLIKWNFAYPAKDAIVFMIALSLIFIVGSILQAEQHDLFFRRSASFFVFMSVFSLMFARIDLHMIQSFKLAIVAWSLFESSISIIEFIEIDGNNLGFHAKGKLGTQRIGFVYLMGFWIVAMFKVSHNKKLLKVIKFLLAYVIVVGMFLTYTRSTLFGLGVSTAAYFVYLAFTSFQNTRSITSSAYKVFSNLAYMIALLALTAVFFKGSVQFYSNTIFNYIFATKAEYAQSDELNLYTSLTVYNAENTHIKGKVVADNLAELEAELIEQFRKEEGDQEQVIAYADESFIDPIISRVARSKEAGLAQQNVNKSKMDLAEAKNIKKSVQAEIERALQEKLAAEESGSFSDIANKNKIYQRYVKAKEAAYQDVVDQQDQVLLRTAQKEVILNRLLTIELQKLMVNTKAQLKSAKDLEDANKIKRKIHNVGLKLSILKSKFLDTDSESNAVVSRMNDKGTSIGYRVFMHKTVLNEVYKSPFLGSAFLGVWTLFENKEGSAHSQYLDILFRVGVVVFMAYLLFLFRVTFFLYKEDIGLFFGFVGFLFFGIFHETIKLSQGAFIFAFLFAMWSQRQHYSDDERTRVIS